MNWKQKAFSMIEIVLVLLLIGILTTIGMNSYKKSVNAGFDTEKKAMVIQIEKILATNSINAAAEFVSYEEESDLLDLLVKNKIELKGDIKNYHYFASNKSFAVATCLSNKTKFYKGEFEPSLDCSNLSTQSIDPGANYDVYINF